METPKNTKPKEPLAGRKILVVDDEPDQLTFIATILEDSGAEVVRAENGETALALTREHRPDLIALDLAMPGKSGIDVFEELRHDPDLAATPVCIITGRPELRRLIYDRADKAPPEGYLNKPVTRDAVVSNVRRILELGDRKKARTTDSTHA